MQVKKIVRLAARYLRRFGFRRFMAACLIAFGHKLSKDISLDEANRVLGSELSDVEFWEKRFAYFDFEMALLSAARESSQSWMSKTDREISSINWFIPDFHHVYVGGIFTIFRFVDYFLRRGVSSRIILTENPIHTDPDQVRNELESVFPAMRKVEILIVPDKIPNSDVSIATRWDTAYRALKQRNTETRFYFIQDYEPLFYPAGTEFALAEATYRFGFLGITNGPWLAEVYKRTYGGQAEYFTPCVDQDLFHPSGPRSRDKIQRLFFYARPKIQRNAFELGVAAIRRIMEAYPEIEVILAGEDMTEYKLPFNYRNCGLLSLAETAALYRDCDVGMSFTWSMHPSYIPLELMASGCAVISNVNPAFEWLLRNNENSLLSEPSPSAIAEAFDKLYANYELREKLVRNGIKTAQTSTWELQMEKIHRYITNQS